jgi:hypothetical protein
MDHARVLEESEEYESNNNGMDQPPQPTTRSSSGLKSQGEWASEVALCASHNFDMLGAETFPNRLALKFLCAEVRADFLSLTGL